MEEVEALLYADFFVFEHLDTGHLEVACNKYHLPNHLTQKVDYITPGIRLRKGDDRNGAKQKRNAPEASVSKRTNAHNIGFSPLPKGFQQQEANAESQFNSSICDTTVTPVCIRSRYTALACCQNGIPVRIGSHL